MEREALVGYLDNYLRIDEIQDYGPQGLQVESDNRAITRIALAVDTAPPIVEEAAAWGADMLLVHHGIFWGQTERIAGPLGARVRLLLRHNINLYAAHWLGCPRGVGTTPIGPAPHHGGRMRCAPEGRPSACWAPSPGTSKRAGRPRGAIPNTEPVVLPTGGLASVAIVSGSAAGHTGEAAAMGADTLARPPIPTTERPAMCHESSFRPYATERSACRPRSPSGREIRC